MSKPQIPKRAVELYNRYIHGEMSRRRFLDGVKALAIGGLTATAIVSALMPRYAEAQRIAKTDDRLATSYDTVASPKGNRNIKGYLVRPRSADSRYGEAKKLAGVVVVHENRGLNPHIEDIARRLGLANFMAFAPDALTSLGGFPGDDAKGGELFKKVDAGKLVEDFDAAARWLKNRPDCSGKIAVIGFCYGGGMASTLAVRLGADQAAAVAFYGRPPDLADVPKIKAAVLVHHGELDTKMVTTWPDYKKALKAAKVPHDGHIYKGCVHGFHCDATPERYDETAADLAWKRTIAWLEKYLV